MKIKLEVYYYGILMEGKKKKIDTFQQLFLNHLPAAANTQL